MSEDKLSKEEQILRAVKSVLTRVVKDTATPPGMKHPLEDDTILSIRDCLGLISARERELAEAAGRPSQARPYFVDEPRKQDVVIPIDSIKRKRPPSRANNGPDEPDEPA